MSDNLQQKLNNIIQINENRIYQHLYNAQRVKE